MKVPFMWPRTDFPDYLFKQLESILAQLEDSSDYLLECRIKFEEMSYFWDGVSLNYGDSIAKLSFWEGGKARVV